VIGLRIFERVQPNCCVKTITEQMHPIPNLPCRSCDESPSPSGEQLHPQWTNGIFMTSGNIETMSTTSSKTQDQAGRSIAPPDRGRQQNRPRRHSHRSPPNPRCPNFLLTSDWPKKQGPDLSQQRSNPTQSSSNPPGPSTPPPVEPESETNGAATEHSMSDEELCFICGSSMNERYFSLSPCNNAFCHNCSLRLRALYKSTNCPFCKVTSLRR